jgi:acetolactate synthase regulatory subunit
MFNPDRLPPNGARARETVSAAPRLAPVFCFSIDVTPDPGTMARVLEQFAKRGLVPTRWHSDVIESDVMQIDIQVVGLSRCQGEHIARCIRSVVGVHGVLITAKAGAAVATGEAPARADRRLLSL